MKIVSKSFDLSKPMIFENRKVGEWLTSEEAAKFLGISPNALRIKVCRGQVQYKKLGPHLRFCKQHLNSLLTQGV